MCKDQELSTLSCLPLNSLSQVAQELRVAGPDPYPIRYPSPKKLVGEGLASPFLFSSLTLPTYTCS